VGLTILRKREKLRRAFARFDVEALAAFNERAALLRPQ
jgi:3-methyladenine DNA glycosylase Tag